MKERLLHTYRLSSETNCLYIDERTYDKLISYSVVVIVEYKCLSLASERLS